MKTNYAYDSYAGEIFGYSVFGNGDTTFPKGTLMVSGDYLTTGLRTLEEAIKWSEEWGCCNTCKSIRKSRDGKCGTCGDDVVIKKAEYTGDY